MIETHYFFIKLTTWFLTSYTLCDQDMANPIILIIYIYIYIYILYILPSVCKVSHYVSVKRILLFGTPVPEISFYTQEGCDES
jgi:hypothetical protein